MSYSEVARLRELIEAEYVAMKRGLTGLASGTAKHEFISTRFKRVEECYGELEEHVGTKEATKIACELYNEVMK